MELVQVPVLNITNSQMHTAIGTGTSMVPVLDITNSQMHAAIRTGKGTDTVLNITNSQIHAAIGTGTGTVLHRQLFPQPAGSALSKLVLLVVGDVEDAQAHPLWFSATLNRLSTCKQQVF